MNGSLKKWAISPVDYDSVVSLRETIDLLDWLDNPFSTQNLDENVFKCETRGVRLVSETTQGQSVDVRIVSVSYCNSSTGPQLELETYNTEQEYVKYFAKLRNRVRGGKKDGEKL